MRLLTNQFIRSVFSDFLTCICAFSFALLIYCISVLLPILTVSGTEMFIFSLFMYVFMLILSIGSGGVITAGTDSLCKRLVVKGERNFWISLFAPWSELDFE